MRPEGFEPPVSAFGGPRVIQLRYGRTWEPRLLGLLGRDWCRRRGQVLEQVELVVDETPIELPHAIRVSEKVRTRVGEIVAGRVRNVVRDLDFFHLAAVDRVGAEIAGDR